MGMSWLYGAADEGESIATIREAIDRGVTLLNTGDFYGNGDNEMLIGRALDGMRDRVMISVKFGAQMDPSGRILGYDARPNAVKTALSYTLRRLRTDHVDIYQPSRVDPNVPIEETVGAIREMIDAGYVRYLGLSEAGADTIRRAHAVHPVTALETEYSLAMRTVEPEVLPTLRELGIGLVPYGVLVRGLLGGRIASKEDFAAGDLRSSHPRFAGENLEHNLEAVRRLKGMAEGKGCTPAQLAIAWVLAQGEDIVPIIGARRRDQLADAVAATEIVLSAEERATLADAFSGDAIIGDRYPAAAMGMLGR
jgi:aryl-alcohol dehydrogenase-like predicted oxidoreductase